MNDLDRLLERAGNAGDLEAEALVLVARELCNLSALMGDVKQAIIKSHVDEKRLASMVADAVSAALRVAPPVADAPHDKRRKVS